MAQPRIVTPTWEKLPESGKVAPTGNSNSNQKELRQTGKNCPNRGMLPQPEKLPESGKFNPTGKNNSKEEELHQPGERYPEREK